jgi:homoserine kinase
MNPTRLVVPSSTSNLGPGFDTLGLALDWPLRAVVKPAAGLAIELEVANPAWKKPLLELVTAAVSAFETAAGCKAGLDLALAGDPPLARGLGSSATYRTAAATAANLVCGSPLDPAALLALVSRLEAHTDNAVPCLLGGLTASGWDGDRVRYARAEVASAFLFVALAPDRQLPTSEARMVLPATVPREDAVQNMQRALWLFRAFAENQPDELRGAFADRLHQPYRLPLVPFLPAVIAAAERAGALGGFLSGAGSAIVAVTDRAHAEPVARAMLRALEKTGESGAVRTLAADNRGTRQE